MMTLEELGQEYLENVPRLEKMIAQKRAQLKEATKKGQLTNAQSLRHDISVLYGMKIDCVKTGTKLKNYYVKEKKRHVRSTCKYK